MAENVNFGTLVDVVESMQKRVKKLVQLQESASSSNNNGNVGQVALPKHCCNNKSTAHTIIN